MTTLSLTATVALQGVMSIELARRLPQRLNVSVPATGADTLRTGTAPNWSGLTGKGVILGLVDDGIDFRHRVFRHADGSTRLLATGLRDTVRNVHAHPSFDRQGRYVQFHSGRTHETVALIDLTELPPGNWTK